MAKFTVGDEVVRSKGDYVVGRIGEVIAISEIQRRAKVKWKGSGTTSVSFDSLELTSIPYEIIPAKYDGIGYRTTWPKYKRK